MQAESNSPATVEAVLRVRTTEQDRRFTLKADELVTIGRSSSCRIQVQDKSVSREHCVAIYTDGKICINDLRSTHGITYEGERVNRCELKPGDQCLLGSAQATFEPALTGAKLGETKAPTAPKEGAVPKQKAAAKAKATAKPAVPAAPTSSPAKEPAEGKQPAGEEPQRAIAGYRILDKLGEGGFGTVYRAEQVQLGREVALKILKRDPAEVDHDARIEFFLREARVAAGLADARLVQVYDVGESDGEHFLSMELVEGGSLARKLRRDGPMEWPQVIRLLRDMGMALKAAHAAGLVHRDVKPGNILLAKSGQFKLTDLGLAANDSHAGTIAFMAPEQLRREPFDKRADIYALGCTAYAALTGSPPFTGDKQEIARAQVKQRPESLLDRNVQVPWHLAQLIVESMMAKDPGDRPQDADALLTRLDRMILPSNAEPVTLDDDDLGGDEYPSVAPKRLGRPTRSSGSTSNSSKAFWARLTGDTIVFTIVGGTVIALLLVLKVVWPGCDIYRLIGR